MTVHKKSPLGQVHVPYNWTYADATARNGAAGLVADDVGKLARQLDDDSLWMLTDHTGPAWIQVTTGAGTSILADGSVPFVGAQSMGGNKLTNVDDGTVAGDAVNYSQLAAVDSQVGTNTGDIATLQTDVGAAEDAIATQHVNGFENKNTDTTITYNEGTRQFQIAPTGATFPVWSAGTKFDHAGDSLTLANTTGLHFIYIDAAGALTVAVNPSTATIRDIISRLAIVAIVYHNATTGKRVLFGDERHGAVMDGDDHLHWHETIGTSYVSGLGPNSILADDSGWLDAHAQIGIGAGEIADEDLTLMLAAHLAASNWRVLYKSGAAGAWTYVSPQAAFPVATAGTGRLAWNEFTGGAWQLTEVSDGGFVLCHLVATNDAEDPIMAVVGEAEYANIADARAAAATELLGINTAGLPMAEWKWIASVIFQTDDTYLNTVKARTRTNDEGDEFVDWRGTRIARPGSGDGVSDHGALTGLTDPDHPVTAVYLPTTGVVTECSDLGCALDIALSSGGLTGLGLTDNGDGTIDIAAGEALLRTGDLDSSPIRACAIPATASPITLTDEAVNYITVRYNGGSPESRAIAAPPLALSEVITYIAVRHGTTVHYVDLRGVSRNTSTKDAIKDFAVYGYEHAKGGSITTETGTRNLAVSSGVFYLGPVRIPHSSFDTSGADDFTYIYKDGAGGWTRTASQTQIDNTQYDDGSGSLATLSNNHYGVHWVYICNNSPAELHVLYGQAQYTTLTAAQAAGEPTNANRPAELKDASTSELVAKVIIEKNGSSFDDIQVPWEDFLASTGGGSPVSAGFEGVTVTNEVSTGTHGGSSTGGSWNTRPLNTLNNPKSYAWISFDDVNDRFTLQSGYYAISIKAQVFAAGAHQLRLRADPAGAPTTALEGHGQACPYWNEEASQTAIIEDVITVTTATVYELQHYAEQTVATYGLGKDSGSGENQVYTTIRVARLGDA
jgi:hypothetical protein